MANVKKFSRGAVGNMTAHFERRKKENPETGEFEYVRFGNQEIDTSRSHLNYNLAPEWGISQAEFVKERTSEVHCLNRDDVNVMCSWVITLPKGFERDREFFHAVYSLLEGKYGKENVVSAYVHMDENQPHMHFAFIPVIYDKDKLRHKVSAKEVLTRQELKKFHPWLEDMLTPWFREPVKLLNQATKDGNKTIDELKAESKIEKAEELADIELRYTESMREMNEELNDTQNELTSKESELEDLDYIIENRRARADRLKEDIERIGADAEREFTQKVQSIETLDKKIGEKTAELQHLEATIAERTLAQRFFEWFQNEMQSKVENTQKIFRKIYSNFERTLQKAREFDLSNITPSRTGYMERIEESVQRAKKPSIREQLAASKVKADEHNARLTQKPRNKGHER